MCDHEPAIMHGAGIGLVLARLHEGSMCSMVQRRAGVRCSPKRFTSGRGLAAGLVLRTRHVMGQVWATGDGSKRQPLRSPLDNGMPRQVLSRAQGMQQTTASQQSDVNQVTKEICITKLHTWVVQRLSSQTPKTRKDQRSHWMMFWQR